MTQLTEQEREFAREAAATPRPEGSVRVAGIDCGTNSIRLMIADVDEAGLHVRVPRIMDVIRLGQDVDRNHAFAPVALERAYASVARFSEIIRLAGGVDRIRFVATSATRDASNREEFEDEVERLLGARPEVIPGTQEARLSFLGATSHLSAQQLRDKAPLLVVDLGGGSTEMVLGGTGEQASEVAQSISMNIGSVRMSERHLLSNPATAEQIAQAQDDIDGILHDALRTVNLEKTRTLIGVSGTITTLSLAAQGEKVYSRELVDGVQVSIEDAKKAADMILSLSTKDMESWPVIHPGRRDVIGGGVLVYSRLLTLVNALTRKAGHEITSYTASERGLLEGIILDAGRSMLTSR